MLLNCLGNVSVNSIPAYERRSSRAGFPRAHCRVTAPISVWWPDERWSEPERSAPSRKATGSGHRRTYSLTKVCNWTFMSAIFHRSWDPPFKKAYFPPAGASFVAVEVDSVLLPLLVSELARLVRWCVDLTATPSFFFRSMPYKQRPFTTENRYGTLYVYFKSVELFFSFKTDEFVGENAGHHREWRGVGWGAGSG